MMLPHGVSLFHGVVVKSPASKLVYVHPMMLCWISWCLFFVMILILLGDSVSLRSLFQIDVDYIHTPIYIYTHTRIETHLMAEIMISCLSGYSSCCWLIFSHKARDTVNPVDIVGNPRSCYHVPLLLLVSYIVPEYHGYHGAYYCWLVLLAIIVGYIVPLLLLVI